MHHHMLRFVGKLSYVENVNLSYVQILLWYKKVESTAVRSSRGSIHMHSHRSPSQEFSGS
jgi:hypothetical protein